MNRYNNRREPSRYRFHFRREYGVMSVLAFFALILFASCSETSGEESEYTDWQSRNNTYFQGIYTSAQQKISSGSKDWMIYKKWSLEDAAATKAEDHIVVQVLQTGTGSGCPMYSDSVKVHYRGRLMPTKSYAEGYIFDQSYTGDLNPATAKAASFTVSGRVDGFTTALMYMHIGDHWRVYIPYALGYGSINKSAAIPAYSTLVFDIQLVSYYRAVTKSTLTRSGKAGLTETEGRWIEQ